MRQKSYSKKHFFVLLLVLFLLASALVFASNQLVTLDTRLERVRKELVRLQPENELLQEKIASASALTTVSQKAEGAGFTTNPQMIAIKSAFPLALNRNL